MKIRNFYTPLLSGGTEDYEKLGWESCKAQYSRFDIMLNSIGFEGMSILDVGCGLGNLMDILKRRDWTVDYCGVDLLPEMIEEAEKKHPEGEWVCCDIFNNCSLSRQSFDIVYSSGIFNLDLGNNRRFLKEALGLFSSLADSYICFNLLSEQSEEKEDGFYYYSDSEVRNLIADHLPVSDSSIQIFHSYLPNDMTVLVDLKNHNIK